MAIWPMRCEVWATYPQPTTPSRSPHWATRFDAPHSPRLDRYRAGRPGIPRRSLGHRAASPARKSTPATVQRGSGHEPRGANRTRPRRLHARARRRRRNHRLLHEHRQQRVFFYGVGAKNCLSHRSGPQRRRAGLRRGVPRRWHETGGMTSRATELCEITPTLAKAGHHERFATPR